MEKLLAIQVHFCDMLESCNGNFGLKTFAETEPHMKTEKCRHPHFEMMHLPVKKRMNLHARLLCNYIYLQPSLPCFAQMPITSCVFTPTALPSPIPLRIPHSLDSYKGDKWREISNLLFLLLRNPLIHSYMCPDQVLNLQPWHKQSTNQLRYQGHTISFPFLSMTNPDLNTHLSSWTYSQLSNPVSSNSSANLCKKQKTHIWFPQLCKCITHPANKGCP